MDKKKAKGKLYGETAELPQCGHWFGCQTAKALTAPPNLSATLPAITPPLTLTMLPSSASGRSALGPHLHRANKPV